MCRMIGLSWEGRDGSKLTSELIKLLYKAAANDPLLGKIANDPRHCHGFGYLLIIDEGYGPKIEFSKFDSISSGETNPCTQNLRELFKATNYLSSRVTSSVKGVILLHARRASRGEPRGTFNAHPFIYLINEGNTRRYIALIHNGGVYKHELARELGVNPQLFTDSHILTLWLGSKLSKRESLDKLLRTAHKYVKSALNVIIADLVISDKVVATLHAYSFIRDDLNAIAKKYYEPVFISDHSVKGFISSTIEELVKDRGLKINVISKKSDYMLTHSITW